MKQAYIVLTLLLLCTGIYSCSDSSIAENQQLYETHSSDNDNGEVNGNPDGNP
jgi:hypothetical protein